MGKQQLVESDDTAMLLFPLLGLRRVWCRPWKADRVSLIFWSESEDLGRIPTGEDNSFFIEKAWSIGQICALEKSCWFLCPQNPRATWTGERSPTHVGNFRLCVWGNETRGDTLLPIVSPVTHHLLIDVLRSQWQRLLLCLLFPVSAPPKRQRKLTVYLGGPSTMNLKGKQHC